MRKGFLFWENNPSPRTWSGPLAPSGFKPGSAGRAMPRPLRRPTLSHASGERVSYGAMIPVVDCVKQKPHSCQIKRNTMVIADHRMRTRSRQKRAGLRPRSWSGPAARRSRVFDPEGAAEATTTCGRPAKRIIRLRIGESRLKPAQRHRFKPMVFGLLSRS